MDAWVNLRSVYRCVKASSTPAAGPPVCLTVVAVQFPGFFLLLAATGALWWKSGRMTRRWESFRTFGSGVRVGSRLRIVSRSYQQPQLASQIEFTQRQSQISKRVLPSYDPLGPTGAGPRR